MKQSLIHLINALPPEKRPSPKSGGDAYIQELEDEFSLSLPKDYVDFITTYHHGTTAGSRMNIHLEPPQMLLGHNLDERFTENIPDMFVIGDDGGGSIYFYDPKDNLGYGAYALFIVPLSSLFFDDAIYVGKSLTEAVSSIVNGEYFFDRPTLEES